MGETLNARPEVLRGEAGGPGAMPPLVRTYFEALNAEDFPRLAELWSDGSELRAVGSRPRHGREEIMTYFSPALFTPWTAHLDAPTRVVDAGSTVVVEVRFSGTTKAGAELTFDAVDVFDLAGDTIARLTTWYDLAWLRKQL